MAGNGSVPSSDEVDKYQFARLYRLCRDNMLNELREAIHFEENVHECLTAVNLRGYTLLHEAVEADNCDIVQLMLQHGVPPDLAGKNKQTPLHLAASKGFDNCAKALIGGGANLLLKDDFGQDAMNKAERNKRRGVIRLLRSRGIVLCINKHVLC